MTLAVPCASPSMKMPILHMYVRPALVKKPASVAYNRRTRLDSLDVLLRLAILRSCNDTASSRT